MIYYLVYVSSAKKLFTPEELIDLLKVARENNAAVGVTGMLLYHDGDFMQLLEGEKSSVEQIFARIQKDPRHRRIITLLQGEKYQRDFPEWSMAFQVLDPSKIPTDSGFSEFLNSSLQQDSFGDHPAGAIRLLQSFRRNAR